MFIEHHQHIRMIK